MPKLKGLKVVETLNASSVYLGTEPETRGQVVRSRMHYVPGPRELDDYHLSGVYYRAGVPVTIEEIRLPEEQHDGAEGYQAMGKEISDAVYQGLMDDRAVFVTGGTCVQAPGVAGGFRRAFGQEAKLGIIWLDAHGDINIPETSPSGMLGGMPFATVLGLCLEDWRKACGLVPPLDDRLAILSDARSFDDTEAENLKRTDLLLIDTADFCDTEKWRLAVQELASKVDALYLHIDADIVDGKFVPSVNTPEPDGPDIRTLLDNIRIVMETGKVSVAALASIYFAPTPGKEKAGPETAILTGIRMIGTILENWQDRGVVLSKAST